ncbi:MAG: hypothetical protein AB1629_07955 [Candidatus Omnitrophota bacterium]
MEKPNKNLPIMSLILLELCYLAWGLFLAIYLPILNYLIPRKMEILGLRFSFPISIYAVAVGLLYLLSAVFMARRRPISFKLSTAANVLGIIFLVPIVMGLISFVLLNRPEIKEQFKK